MNKYEQLIEFIINEDEAKARELFHQIVVEKSREIYESLIDEDDLAEVGGNEVESMMDEVTSDEEGMDEAEDVEASMDDEEEDDMGGDDMGDEFGGEELGGEEGDIEDRVMDLEDALDELKAEFDALMGQEAGEHEHGDMGGEELGGEEGSEDMMYEAEEDDDEEEDLDESADDEEDDDEEDVEESIQESKKSKKEEMLKGKNAKKMTEAEWIREYVEKIGDIYGQEPAKGEGNEVGNGGKATVTPKSIVAGKNDMGGTAKNLNQAGKGEDPDNKPVPQPNNQYTKGKGNLPGAGQFKNVPGGNAGKTSFKTKEGDYATEHGAEGETTGGKVSVDKKSILKRIGK